MENPRWLSGYEIVAKGITKLDSSLPEVGVKDVTPNGSWLEQKQIQSALEARKQLIEVERIEKCGAISHAEWREELQLAEVTQKVGGYWQFLGHNVGKELFLYPEEALFLMEVNSLKLTFNEVIVSFQQAYSLLLSGKISLLQYRVYASLSRLGYKVFRHNFCKVTACETESNATSMEGQETVADMEIVENSDNLMHVDEENENRDQYPSCNEDSIETICTNSTNKDIAVDEDKRPDDTEINMVEQNSVHLQLKPVKDSQADTEAGTISLIDLTDRNTPNECHRDEIIVDDNNVAKDCENVASTIESLSDHDHINTNENPEVSQTQTNSCSRLDKVTDRSLKPCNNKKLEKFLSSIPDLYQKETVTVKVPEEEHIPKNIFLNNISYNLNIQSIRAKIKDAKPQSTESGAYSTTEEVNGPNVPRVSNIANNSATNTNTWNYRQNSRPRRNNFGNFSFWRPQQYNLGWRPFAQNLHFVPRFQYFPRVPPPLYRLPGHWMNSNPRNFNNVTARQNKNNPRKRTSRQNHLNQIKSLTDRLKQIVRGGIVRSENKVALERLIESYNIRYSTRLRLTPNLDLVSDEFVVDTIELVDEEEVSRKRARTENDQNKYDENLDKVKHLASVLKDLDSEQKACSRQKRALSKLVKKFNKAYGANIYINDNYEVIDKSRIILDDSSESDCIVEDEPVPSKPSQETVVLDDEPTDSNARQESLGTHSRKKLKNPFSILYKLAKKNQTVVANEIEERNEGHKVKYPESLTTIFSNNWLPSEDDFGRAEVVPKSLMYDFLMNSKRDEYIYEFMKSLQCDFENWLEAKISFYRNVELNKVALQEELSRRTETTIESIIKPEDCNDTASVLEKLSIIKTAEIDECHTDLNIDFDVYNRDVQKFRKSNKPKPHFRIICVNESSKFLSGGEVAALHARYKDEVPIVFAVVSLASISYLQIKPSNLPVYIPNKDIL